MARLITVDRPDDDRLGAYRHLLDASRRRAIERAAATFVVEGVTAIRRLLVSPYATQSLLVTPAVAQRLRADLAGRTVDVFVAPLEVLRAVAGFDIHRGALALGRRPEPSPLGAVAAGAATLVALEALNDHENLGAIARSAVALGVDGLALDPTCADPLYRRCVRVSMGEILFLPFARTEPWPLGLGALQAQGFVLVALTPAPDAAPLADLVPSLHGRRVAVLLGAEGTGLSAGSLAAADHRVRIPMRSGSDSLNVGHAAAIAFDRLRDR